MTTTRYVTPYKDIAMDYVAQDCLKQLACSLLLSAIEDADVEFLTDDYDEWKYYREKRKKKSEVLIEPDYRMEFGMKQNWKEVLFHICDVYLHVSDIPKENLEQRRLFEKNNLTELCKITGYKKETLSNMSKFHGWKIGIDYVEPTMFDDDF